MFDFPYIIEILSPKIDAGERLNELLDKFSVKYTRSLTSGCGISVPDNPMGQKRFSLPECIEQIGLKVEPKKIVMNLNTFHSKEKLDSILRRAIDLGIDKLLIIRGDGGPGLEKLDPGAIGGKHSVATSPDLLNYINSEYAGYFQTGAAFNPYKSVDFELRHMQKKIDAGAQFVITQPILGRDENVDTLLEHFKVPVIVEAWMSQNIELFLKSVGKDAAEGISDYDPLKNLKSLHEAYPESCVYLALLSFVSDWQKILPRLNY